MVINCENTTKYDLPRVPGTRDMYSTRDSRGCSVGFTGYWGGFAARKLSDERDLASKFAAMMMNSSSPRWAALDAVVRPAASAQGSVLLTAGG